MVTTICKNTEEFCYKVFQKVLDENTYNVSCKDRKSVEGFAGDGLCVGFMFNGVPAGNDEWIAVPLEKAVENPVIVGSATKRMSLCFLLKLAIEGRINKSQPDIKDILDSLDKPIINKETKEHNPFGMIDLSE